MSSSSRLYGESDSCKVDLPVFVSPNELVFAINKRRSLLTVFNPYSSEAQFRIMTTNPDRFDVSVTKGIIKPSRRIDITIRLLSQKVEELPEPIEESQTIDYFRITLQVGQLKGNKPIKVNWCLSAELLEAEEGHVHLMNEDKASKLKLKSLKTPSTGHSIRLGDDSTAPSHSQRPFHNRKSRQVDSGSNVNLVVPARFAEKFSVVQAKSGESAKLECNATGDQPLTVNWFKEDSKLSKRGGENFEIYETMTAGGINSVLVVRTVSRSDGMTYKCVGENEYGNDERLIKLMVVEVPSRPMNVRVKDAWSRSASLVWSTPFAGNSPITSYVIQYWKKSINEAGLSSQNHRRQEFSVSGTQTSALLTNLMPSLTYEASVIAENQVGRSEPSENVAINTGEDEPTAAPSDVSVEARGPSTIRVAWKVPPSETWNGRLSGFYIGFRPRSASNSIDAHQNIQMAGTGPSAFSYRTVDYVKGQQVFEAFLTNLMRGHEYEVVVKTFNNIGSGPESHLMAVRTFDGDLPAPPSLFAHQATHSSISLRWTYSSRAQSSASSIKRYILYYQRLGDESWLEIGIPVEEKIRSSAGHQSHDGGANMGGLSISESGTTSYLLSGLDSGAAYKIYVVAVNNFGMGDPSNVVTTKTDGASSGANSDSLRSSSHSSDFNVFEMNRQFQMFLVVSVVCTVILVVIVISAVLYCTRRMQSPQTQHVITSQPQTLQSAGSWGPEGTISVGQRYVEFDKGGILKTNGSLLTGTQNSDQNSSIHQNNGGHYPLPYGTMPMNSVVISDQKSWDRQSSAPLKPLVTHIYDSPI